MVPGSPASWGVAIVERYHTTTAAAAGVQQGGENLSLIPCGKPFTLEIEALDANHNRQASTQASRALREWCLEAFLVLLYLEQQGPQARCIKDADGYLLEGFLFSWMSSGGSAVELTVYQQLQIRPAGKDVLQGRVRVRCVLLPHALSLQPHTISIGFSLVVCAHLFAGVALRVQQSAPLLSFSVSLKTLKCS